MNEYFLGIKVSETGRENGRVDLETLGKVVNGIPNNKIVEKTTDCGITWELVNGSAEDCSDISEYYMISKDAAELIKKKDAEQIVLYCEYLDVYVWGITAYGVPWEDVLTNIEL